jgi:hypothetical protein
MDRTKRLLFYVQLLVSAGEPQFGNSGGYISVDGPSVTDHEVID